MGIQGLLPALRSVTDQVHISAYANQTVAVDTYCWLHRGAISAAAALCKDPDASDVYISFVLGRIQLLLDAQVKPFLVFDGGLLPAKKAQEQARAERRQISLQTAMRMEASGFKSAAERHYRQALDITPWMAKKTIEAIQAKYADRVRFVVAPYEADAQLTWLVNNGHASAALTEDSDLLAFGCERVLFKLDAAGRVDQICLKNLGACQQLDLARWTLAEFQLMCVLSGCDYVASPEGLGLKTAHKLVSVNKTPDRIIRRLRLQGKYKIPNDYARSVDEALLTFRHQRVYDIVHKHLVNLYPLRETVDLGKSDTDFLGSDLPKEVAVKVAESHLDPISLKLYDERYTIKAQESSPSPKQIKNEKRAFQSCFVRSERITLDRSYGVVPRNPHFFQKFLKLR